MASYTKLHQMIYEKRSTSTLSFSFFLLCTRRNRKTGYLDVFISFRLNFRNDGDIIAPDICYVIVLGCLIPACSKLEIFIQVPHVIFAKLRKKK